MSKSDKERVERNKLKLQQILEAQKTSNILITALAGETAAEPEEVTESVEQKKKVVYTKKKKTIPKQMSNGNRNELATNLGPKARKEAED